MTDRGLQDAFFLVAHPSWSQRDLDDADQDIVDYLSAIQHEGALESERQRQKAERESAASAHRASLRAR